MRQGIVLVSGDSTAATFLNGLLEDHFPGGLGSLIEVDRGRTCLAAVGGSRQRRLVIIDGEPPDISAGALLDAIRLADPDVPIVLVQSPTNETTVLDGIVKVYPQPFASGVFDSGSGALSGASPGGLHILNGPFTRDSIGRSLVELLCERPLPSGTPPAPSGRGAS